MSLKDYLQGIANAVKNARFLSSHSLSLEERFPHLGLIKGSLIFIDGSQLHFTEFVDFEYKTEKIKYSYHYMKEKELIFRYDNRSDPKAKNLETYPHHKHIISGLLPAKPPTLSDVLKEIESNIKIE